MKQLLILLSLMLCFGSASGQEKLLGHHQVKTNLFCDGGKNTVPDLLIIKSPTNNKKGEVWSFGRELFYIKRETTFYSESIGVLGGSLNRKTLQLTREYSSSKCEIISDSKMEEYEKERIYRYRIEARGNMI